MADNSEKNRKTKTEADKILHAITKGRELTLLYQVFKSLCVVLLLTTHSFIDLIIFVAQAANKNIVVTNAAILVITSIHCMAVVLLIVCMSIIVLYLGFIRAIYFKNSDKN